MLKQYFEDTRLERGFMCIESLDACLAAEVLC